MKKFTFTFAATGGVTIEADSREEAQKKFDTIPNDILLEELEACGVEQSDCFEEDE